MDAALDLMEEENMTYSEALSNVQSDSGYMDEDGDFVAGYHSSKSNKGLSLWQRFKKAIVKWTNSFNPSRFEVPVGNMGGIRGSLSPFGLTSGLNSPKGFEYDNSSNTISLGYPSNNRDNENLENLNFQEDRQHISLKVN